MPRLPKSLARRIDRASRAAHRFHRFAHHPLCHAYAGEVILLGSRTRICRGCAYLLVGGAVGAALGLGLRSSPWIGTTLPLAWALAVVGAYRRWPKHLTRLLPACIVGACCVSGLWPLMGAGVTTLGVYARFRARGPHRAPCTGCPERALRVCSGFAAVVRREKAFAALARRWIDAYGLSLAKK